MPSSRRLIKDPVRYKTVLCEKWEANGACPYGAKCQFAHGIDELRSRPCAGSEGAQCAPCVDRPTRPGLSEQSIALARACGVDARLPIPRVIDQAAAKLGVQGAVHALSTLPAKMEACMEAAARQSNGPTRPASPLPSVADNETHTPAPPLPPAPALAAPACLRVAQQTRVVPGVVPPLVARVQSHTTWLVNTICDSVLEDERDAYDAPCAALASSRPSARVMAHSMWPALRDGIAKMHGC